MTKCYQRSHQMGVQSHRLEVYLRTFDGKRATGGAARVSIDGGSHPQWRPDGKELFFLSPDRKLMVADVTRSPWLKTERPKSLFQTRIQMLTFLMNYAVADNGQRFLVNTLATEAETGPVTVIANWYPSAKRLGDRGR
jgi:eukaryotic-like serine/threonine-protein kinase